MNIKTLSVETLIEKTKKKLQDQIVYFYLNHGKEGEKRMQHVYHVFQKALELNELYDLGFPYEVLERTMLFHDSLKFFEEDDYKKLKVKKTDLAHFNESSKTWHALFAPYVLKEKIPEFTEEELTAIKYHTTGNSKMSSLGELLFISDFLENTRKIPLIFKNYKKYTIKEIVGLILKFKIEKNKKNLLHPLTLKAYDTYKKYVDEKIYKLYEISNLIIETFVKDIVVYKMDKVTPFYDYSLIVTALSLRQLKACANLIRETFDISKIELGEEWVLIDLGDIVIHLFSSDARERYAIDKLYNDLDHFVIE